MNNNDLVGRKMKISECPIGTFHRHGSYINILIERPGPGNIFYRAICLNSPGDTNITTNPDLIVKIISPEEAILYSKIRNQPIK